MNISSIIDVMFAAGEEEQTHGDESTDGADDEWSLRVFSVSEIRPTIGQPIMNPINKAVISVLA